MFSMPVVLKALTTCAPGASAAICSAPELWCPTVSTSPGPSGLVTSISTRPRRSPAPRSASAAAWKGVASSSTSAAAAVALGLAVAAPA